MRKLSLVALFFLIFKIAFSQNSVEGFIADSDGVPVVAVTVLVKGTHFFAVSDVDGKFRIDVHQSPPFTLQFSSVGLIPKEIEILPSTVRPLKVIM